MVELVDPLDSPEEQEPQGPISKPLPKLEPWVQAKRTYGIKTRPRGAETYRGAKRNIEQGRDVFGREAALVNDFRNFLTVIWEYVGRNWPTGCVPSAVQLSLAHWLQNGPKRQIILGFRGMAKSWITGAYALWRLYCDPQTKILIVSASMDRAVQTVQWCLALIREIPELKFLIPRDDQRQSSRSFDVAPATPAQSPSMRAAGINGQMAGARGDLIVADDIEIPANSMTTLMREQINERVKEFDAILTPGGEVKFLGTPQVDDSVYNKLQKRGYTCRIWPAEYPDVELQLRYGDKLAPFILNQVQRDPTLAGHSTWKERFSDDDLAGRKLSYGRSGYALQFLLDTSLSDADRFPLKLSDLIVEPLDLEYAPDVITWGNDQKLILNNLPVMGFDGDHYYGPANKGESVSKYNSILAWIDPSGRGGDETSLNIVAELHGRIFHLFTGGWRDGYSTATLKAIADKLVQFRVQRALVEDNFGDGMFLALLTPHVIQAWRNKNSKDHSSRHSGTDLEGIRSPRVQKELRILAALEPCIQSHRLVISTAVIEQDFKSIQAYADKVGQEGVHHYSLIHQLTHLTREKDCLVHDDRLEGLAGAVSQFADILGIAPWESAAQREEERIEAELEALFQESDAVTHQAGGSPTWRRNKYPVRPN